MAPSIDFIAIQLIKMTLIHYQGYQYGQISFVLEVNSCLKFRFYISEKKIS